MSAKTAEVVRAFARNQEGATMVEYGVMLALIAAVCVLAISVVGSKANSKFSDQQLTTALQ